MFYRNSKTRIADVTDGLSNTLAVGEKNAKNTMATWVGVIPGATWRSANDVANYGGVPSNLAGGEGARARLPAAPAERDAGVAEDFSAPHINGVNIAVRRRLGPRGPDGVNMRSTRSPRPSPTASRSSRTS